MNSQSDAARSTAIVAHLRTLTTVTDGAAYLRAQRLDRHGLLAVAAAAGLTRLDRLSNPKLLDRILQQTIAARTRFAGLRKW